MIIQLCLRHPEYFRLAGSDTHRVGDECRAGVVLPRRIKDSFDMKHMLETMQFQLWAPDAQDFVDADTEIRAKNARK